MSPAPRSAAEALAERRARKEHWETAEARARAAAARLSNARLAVFALGGLAGLWLLKTHVELWPLLTVPIGLFVVLVVRHQRADQRARHAARLAGHARFRADRLEGRWDDLPAPGQASALAAEHLFARDLDLASDASLLSLLGAPERSLVTPSALLGWLSEPPRLDAVRARQDNVETLAADDSRLETVAGLPALDDGHESLIAWARSPARPPGGATLALATLLSLAAAGATLWWLFADGPLLALGLVAVVEALVDTLRARSATERVPVLASASAGVARLAGLLESLESDELALKSLGADADASESAAAGAPTDASPTSSASAALAELRRRLEGLIDSRRNAFLFLPTFLLRLNVVRELGLERWRARHGAELPGWLTRADAYEGLLLLAAYRRDHPEDARPELLDGPPRLSAEGLMHPFLRPAEGVRNDVELGGPTRLLVVSGSNMSGKSTLLRALGTNLMLAFAGAPVRATRLALSALQIGASLRSRDSLLEGRSRFMAEIEGLRRLEQATTSGPLPVLALLDELLAGTNSSDRLAGARSLIDHLLAHDALVVLTTHDLALTELAADAARPGRNVHFLDDLRDGRPHFDHRLRPGVVPRGNGLELMRSLGLPV